MRQRLPAGSPLAALGLAVAAVAAYVLTYALEQTSFLNDEYGNVIGGRLMEREPLESLTATSGTVFGRGPERLVSIVFALPNALLGSTPDEFRAYHVLAAVAYALVAVPVFLLLRGLDVPRWPSVGLAVAAILGPWVVFGTTLLNVTLAAPLTVLFAWAAWRAVVRPSVRAEVVALLCGALMTTARASHAVFFAALVAAAVCTAWWTLPEASPGASRLRAFPRWVWRRTPVTVAVAVLGALALAVFGPSALAGRDYAGAARLHLPWEQLWNALGWTTAVLTIATGFVPLMVGGAWALRQAVRPADVRAGAFAVIALTTFFAYVYLMGASGAQEQERYAAPLAALPIVCFGAALYRAREAWLLGTAVVGLLAARAIATHADDPGAEALSYFFSPGEILFEKVVVGRLTTILPFDAQMTTIALLALVALATLTCLAPQYERAWHRNVNVPGTAVVVLLVFAGVSGVYTLRKYEPFTAPGDLEAMDWLDEAAGGAPVLLWNYQWEGNAADRDYRTRLTMYFNATPCCGEWPADPGASVTWSGRVRRGGDPRPAFLAGPTGFRPIVFAATDVARPDGFGAPMRVQRFEGQPRAAARILRAEADGAVDDTAAIVTLPGLRGRCIDVELYSRPDAVSPVGFALAGERGRLRADENRWVRVRGDAEVRRTSGEALLYVEETRFVDCDAPPPEPPG